MMVTSRTYVLLNTFPGDDSAERSIFRSITEASLV